VSLCRSLFQQRHVERELDDELRAYLDELTDEKRRNGAEPAATHREARIELGGIDQVKEEVRQVRSGRMLEELLKDLRYGARTLRRNPAFSAVAVLALALGIGANTAMFSVAYGILVRPLPYPAADRIAVVNMHYFPRDFAFGTLCIRDFLTWRDNNHSFEEPSLFRNRVLGSRSSGRFPNRCRVQSLPPASSPRSACGPCGAAPSLPATTDRQAPRWPCSTRVCGAGVLAPTPP
jgi:hypothetical protein